MLNGVYKLLAESESGLVSEAQTDKTNKSPPQPIVEVTVEDPCEGFKRLRDAVDMEHCCNHFYRITGTLSCFEKPLFNQVQIEEIAKILKITIGQAAFLSEAEQFIENSKLLNLSINHNHNDNHNHNHNGEIEKKHRLGVKRRLLQENPDLKDLEKEKMKEELEELYSEQLKRFEQAKRTRSRIVDNITSSASASRPPPSKSETKGVGNHDNASSSLIATVATK